MDNRLAAIDFINIKNEIKPVDETAAIICNRVRKYLDDPLALSKIEIPCAISGTPFQKKVWNELKKIPVGKVVTYGEIAKRLDTSARAVGNACRQNPIPVIVPCHRVVSAGGTGGYAGASGGDLLKFKLWLLKHEGAALD